jgi:hypothetical protein
LEQNQASTEAVMDGYRVESGSPEICDLALKLFRQTPLMKEHKPGDRYKITLTMEKVDN